nr:hypothetical protein [Verrucomicrobium spinosum]
MITNILEFIWNSWWLKIPLSLIALWYFLGVVYIGEQKVGIVIKRFAMRNLPPGRSSR